MIQQVKRDYSTIEQAILYLAGHCDGAATLDGKGFNGADAEYGHELADYLVSGRKFSYRQEYEAWKMCKKYWRQLRKGSIELPKKLEEVLEADEVDRECWAVTNLHKGTCYHVFVDGGRLISNCECPAYQNGFLCDHAALVGQKIADRINNSKKVIELPVKKSIAVVREYQEENKGDRAWVGSEYRSGLTDDQKRGFDLAHEWFTAKPSDGFVVSAPAGCGKTFTCQRIVLSLKDLNPKLRVALCAPTHKARLVLEQMAIEAGLNDAYISTLHSLCHLRPGNYTKNGKQRLDVNPFSKEPHYREFGIVVVDESSQVGDELYSHIPTYIPTIFMGDACQLPPVEDGREDEEGNPIAESQESPIFRLPTGIQLTEVVRYSGAIMEYVTAIRSDLDAQFPPRFENTGNMIRMNGDAWMENLIESFRIHENNPIGVRAVAWTNKRVAAINQAVRSALFPGEIETYTKGERLMAKEPVFTLNSWGDREILMYSCAECTVDNVYKSREKLGSPLTGIPIEVYQVEITTDMGREATVTAVHPNSWMDAKNFFAKRRTDILSLDPNDRRECWKEFYTVLEDFNLIIKGGTILNRLQYCHALTVHQAQGSTYLEVFADINNMMGCRQSNQLRNKLLYTACTRAKEALFGLTRF